MQDYLGLHRGLRGFTRFEVVGTLKDNPIPNPKTLGPRSSCTQEQKPWNLGNESVAYGPLTQKYLEMSGR